MRLFRTLILLFLAGLAAPLPASGFQLPGLQRDASAYQTELRRRFPAGGNAQQRAQAEQKAQQAERSRDWAAAVSAWEERIGLGGATAENWMSLGRAQLARTPPEPARALQAGWYAFSLFPSGAPEVPALLLMAVASTMLTVPVVAPRLARLKSLINRSA